MGGGLKWVNVYSLNFTPGLFTAHRKRFAFHSTVPVSPVCGDAARWWERAADCPGRWPVLQFRARGFIKVHFLSAVLLAALYRLLQLCANSHRLSSNARNIDDTRTFERMEDKMRTKVKAAVEGGKVPESMFGLNQSLRSSCF